MTHRLTYNSVNIDGLMIDPQGPNTTFENNTRFNRSGSGKVEAISVYGIHRLSFNAYFSESTYRALIPWFAWASQGQTFSFAIDSTDVLSTTLDGAAASGQKVIPLASTTGVAVYDACLIRSADGDSFEQVSVASYGSGSVTAVTNLIYTYASGDSFRHLSYYPSLVYTAGAFRPTRYLLTDSTSNFYYSFNFEFEEFL